MARTLALLALAATLMAVDARPSGFYYWANNWGGYMSWSCPSNQVMDGWYGVYSNSRQDRRYSFSCTSVNSVSSRTLDNYYVNGWRRSFTKQCPTNWAVDRVVSTHSDYRDDRLWRFGCARHTGASGVYHSSCSWSGWANNWPSYYPYYFWYPYYYYFWYYRYPFYYYRYPTLSYKASSSHVITGIQSSYSYTFRDRRWRFRSCRVSCGSGWRRSGTKCVCSGSSYLRGGSCVSSRQCGRGQYASSSYNNRYCYNCRPGKYQDRSSHTYTSCKSCGRGSFQNNYGQSSCKSCPASQYNPFTGQTSCRDCSRGYYRSSSTRQTRCQPGYRCPGSCSRVACSPGTYQNGYGQRSCKTCEAGKYQTGSAKTSCKNCPDGYYTNSASSDPIRCQRGYACSSCHRRACNGESYQDATGQPGCKQASRCGAGQYVSRAPSRTRNRQCGSCVQGRTYQDASSHTFGSCKSVRNCGAGQYVVSDPTLTSNRVCAQCGDNTYSTGVNAKSCQPLDTCNKGEYAFFTSANSGVDCRACSPGSTYQDEDDHRNKECKTVSEDCPQGKFESVGPTRTSDRVCSECPDNSFSDSQGSTECTTHTTCGLGFIETSPATPTSDRQCRRCNGNTEYQDNTGQASCKSVTTCGAGEYETRAPSPSNDRECATCTSSCPDGKVLVGSCGGTSNPTCDACHASCATCDGPTESDCQSCADSNLVLQEGRCVNLECGDGEYKDGNQCVSCHSSCAECDGAGQDRCISCKGDLYLDGNSCVPKCPTGFFKHTNSDNDNVCRRCSSCESGKYASGPCDGTTSQDTVCSPWSTCGIGEEEKMTPNTVRDRECQPCKEGEEYQDRPGKLFCNSVTVCQHGYFVATEPTASTDRQCSKCQPGYFSNDDNAARCLPCAAGSFQDESGAPSCKECGIGMYEPKQKQTQCAGIPEGYYGTGGTIATRTGIAKCPAGYYCLGGSHDKRPCPPDQFQPLEGQHTCHDLTVCGDGEFVSKEPTSQRDRECSTCPDGTYQDDSDHEATKCISWTTCPAGTHISVTGNARRDQQCASCDAPHTFQDKENQLTCKAVSDCPLGTAELVGPTPSADRTCHSCESGTDYADDTGLEACKSVTNCEPGYREVTAPTVSSDRVCQKCGPNTYTETENEETCREHELCGPGEKEVEEPTTGSNRQCIPCDEGTYQDATSHSSESCIAVTDCEPGTYLAVPATRTSDAVCKSCKHGKTYSSTTNADMCMPVSTCGRGEREKLEPTTSSDRVCEPCRDGHFQDSASHSYSSCKDWTDCSPGEFIVDEGSNATDRVCDSCSGVVKYQPRTNQLNCLNVTRCEATEYELTPPAANRDRVCAECTKADSCNTNEYLAGTCGGNDGVENTRCAACHPTCNGCTGPDKDECTACPRHLQLRNGECISECPDGEYELDSGCAQCHASCFDCDGPSEFECLACKDGRNLLVDENGQSCVDECPRNYYAKDNRCQPCTTCETGLWASTPCSATADSVCSPWSECKPGQKQSVSGTAVRDRVCVSCTLGMEYQPLPDRATCFPTSVCEEPYIETIGPTLTTDRLCSCDTLTCNKLITRIFEEEVCAEPTDEQLHEVLDTCCSGQGEEGIRNVVREMDVYEARHSCPGCTDTCECSAGFVLVHDRESSNCVACDGKDEYAPTDGLSRCLHVDDCQRGQEEVEPPTKSSNRICRDCPAGTIDDDDDPATACSTCPAGHFTEKGSHGKCSVFNCRRGTHDHDEDPATPCDPCVLGETYQNEEGQTECKQVTVCKAGEEEVQAMTLIGDRVCDQCSEGTFKAVEGQGTPCLTVSECAAGFEETAKPTPTSDRVCSACEEGVSFKPAAGQSTMCEPVTECAPGEEEILEPTTERDRVCRSCVLGVSFSGSAGTPCEPVSRCAASEYISTAATLTSDLECSSVSKCEFGFFQSEEPALDSDRECSECSECPSGRFEIRACSSLDDVQCSGCSTCPSRTYILQPCDTENDVSCADCSSCNDEQYRSAPCTLTSDTVCTALDVCDQDQFELYPATPTTDRICRDLTACDRNTEYERNAPTPTTDRLCHLITECDPGEEEQFSATTTSDAKCIPCPVGTTDHDRNPGTPCQPCPYGHFVPAGSIGTCDHFLCPAGTADTDDNASTPCTPCDSGVSFAELAGQWDCTPVSECEPGYEGVVKPTLFTDRQCRRCIEGLFFRDENEEFCTRVSLCDSDSFETAPPTISSDRECQVGTMCLNGTFISRPLSPTRDRICSRWTECLSNEYEFVAPSVFTDRECRRVRTCDPDTEYEVSTPTATTDRLCAAVATCPSEQFEVAAPTATTDRVCALAYSVSLIFDAKFNAVVGTTSRREAFDRELRSTINQTLDASLILRTEYREGSIIVTVASLSEDFTAALFNLTVSGDIVVQGFSSAPCEPDEYLDDADPGPFGAIPCSPVTLCRSNQFESAPPTSTTDRECEIARICRLNEYVVSEFTATTDRVCGTTTTTTTTTTTQNATTPLASTGKSASLAPGIIVLIGLLSLLVLVVGIVFAVYQTRRAEKDRRQNEAIQQWATTNKASDEISQANTLLRQLSLRDQSVLLFDNPMFSTPGGSQRPDWYVGQMTRAQAEDHVLKNSGNVGDFVVRESAANGNFVLTLLIDGGQFEHHKLYKDAQGRFLINGNRPSMDCMTLDVLIDHLSRQMDGTSALLNVQESYGQVKRPQAEESDDFYGSLNTQESPDFYGSVMKEDKPSYMYGPMARGEAEAILAQDRTKGNFLVRESKARPGTYAISLVIDDGRVEHHTLRHNGSEYVLNDLPLSARCDTMTQVIDHLATNEESMSCTLRLERDAPPPAEIPGMEGFSNPSYSREGAGTGDGGYDPLTAPRGVVANPGYQDLPPKPNHLVEVGAAADLSYTDDLAATPAAEGEEDAPPINVRTLPKPYHLLPEKPDASA